jgi:type III secretion protein W
MDLSSGPDRIDRSNPLQGAENLHIEQQKGGQQIESTSSFRHAFMEKFNPFAEGLAKNQKSFKENSPRIEKMLKTLSEKQLSALENVKDTAQRFNQRNPELKVTVLVLLSDHIKLGDSKEVILKKLQQFYPDVSLADEALDYLIEVSEQQQLAEELKRSKEEMNLQHGREITSGRNIQAQVQSAAAQGLGTPTSLRDLYRDITGNPREATTLFEELSQKYAFKDLKAVADFLLHALGTDLKAKGPSIPPGQLHRLVSEARSLQAILGVYRFFRSRMNLVQTLFLKENLTMPSELTFENFAKVFISLVNERYPTADKVLQSARRLGVEDWLVAKIIALSQLRDAIREVSLGRIYRSLEHRDELYMSIIEALEDLEDELEELLDEEKEEEEDS